MTTEHDSPLERAVRAETREVALAKRVAELEGVLTNRLDAELEYNHRVRAELVTERDAARAERDKWLRMLGEVAALVGVEDGDDVADAVAARLKPLLIPDAPDDEVQVCYCGHCEVERQRRAGEVKP